MKMMSILGSERNSVIQSDTNRKNLWNAGMALVQATQTSEQQVAWFLLAFPLVECTRLVISVNTTHPSQKLKLLDLNTANDDADQEPADEPDENLKMDRSVQAFMALDVEKYPQ